jgi:hypothetical protein
MNNDMDVCSIFITACGLISWIWKGGRNVVHYAVKMPSGSDMEEREWVDSNVESISK